MKEYTEFCSACKQIKFIKHLLHGELQLLLLPMGLRQDWMMDFITGLFSNKLMNIVFNAILIVVDRYIKFVKYIPSCKD